MKTKIILFAFLSLLVGFSACNDSNEPEIDQPATGILLIKTMTSSGNYKDSVHYEYDDSGKLIKISHSQSYYTKYTHKPGKVIMELYMGNTSPEQTNTYLINEEGLATSSYIGYVIPNIINTFEYDSNGYKILKKANNDTIVTAKILDGNTIVKTEFDRQDKLINLTMEYQFLTNINTIGDENRGITWEGKQNKNLPSQVTQVIKTHNIRSEEITEYTYEYDTQNRVTKRTGTRNGALNQTESYTYY